MTKTADTVLPTRTGADSGQGGWHEQVLAIGQRNGVTRADVDALMQAIHEADEPIADLQVFEE